jgi:hypothetical protein
MTLPSFGYGLQLEPLDVVLGDRGIIGEAFVAELTAPLSGLVRLPGWMRVQCASEGRTAQQSASTTLSGYAAHAARAFSTDGTTFGLLIEPAASNLVPAQPSDPLGNWMSTVTQNAVAAPDGTTGNHEYEDTSAVAVEDHTRPTTVGTVALPHTLSAWHQLLAPVPTTDSRLAYTGLAFLSFDGVDESVTVPHDNAFDLVNSDGNGVTLMCWIRVAASVADGYVMGTTRENTTFQGHGIALDAGRPTFFACSNRFLGVSVVEVRSDVAIDDGDWHHIAVSAVRVGSNNWTIAWYIDDVAVATTQVWNTLANNVTDYGEPFTFAARGQLGVEVDFLDCDLTNAAHFNDDLTAGEVSTIFAGGISADISAVDTSGDLNFYWPMNGVAPVAFPTVPETENAADGTMQNMESGDVTTVGAAIVLTAVEAAWSFSEVTMPDITDGTLRIAPRATTAADVGACRWFGLQLEQRSYATSYHASSRLADQLEAVSSVVMPDGFAKFDMVFRPHYAHDEASGDHNLFYVDDDNRIYFRQSDANIVFRWNGDDLASGALTFDAHDTLTLFFENSTRRRRLTVSGALSGDGTVDGTLQPALDPTTLPTFTSLLGGATGAEEAADLLQLDPYLQTFKELGDCRVLSQMDDAFGARNFRDWMQIVACQPGRLFDVINGLKAALELPTAVGAQLDLIGAIVGLAREGATDAQYRIYLEIQTELLLANVRDEAEWTGTGENLLRIVRTFIGSAAGAITLSNLPPYSYHLTIPVGLTVTQALLLARFLRIATYAGVLGFFDFALGADTWGSASVAVATAGTWGSASVVVAGVSIWDLVITV